MTKHDKTRPGQAGMDKYKPSIASKYLLNTGQRRDKTGTETETRQAETCKQKHNRNADRQKTNIDRDEDKTETPCASAIVVSEATAAAAAAAGEKPRPCGATGRVGEKTSLTSIPTQKTGITIHDQTTIKRIKQKTKR